MLSGKARSAMSSRSALIRSQRFHQFVIRLEHKLQLSRGSGNQYASHASKIIITPISATSPLASPALFFKVIYSIAGIAKPSQVIVGHYLSFISPTCNLLQPVGNKTARAGWSKSASGKATREKVLISQCQLAQSFYMQSALLKT